MLIEIATFSVEAAIIAQESGADRIELCSSPLEGGLTPSLGTIRTVRNLLAIPVYVMIRPREGDFYYSRGEFDSMLIDIEILNNEGIDGIVTGVLNSNGSVDVSRIKAIKSHSGKMDITFHRAFDMTRDPFEAMDSLVDCGINRILTSGSKATAMEGIERIKELVQKAEKRISIMPGSGINETNVMEIIYETGVEEVHLSAKKIMDGKMQFRNCSVSIGSQNIMTEYDFLIPDGNMIRRIKSLLT